MSHQSPGLSGRPTSRSGGAWVTSRQLAETNARLRLYCFPYAGGGASMYRLWADELSPEIEVCPIQLPGREDRYRETPFRRIGDLVPVLADALAPYLGLPFAFFGHSLGSLIGFELSRKLRDEYNLSPVHLLVSSRRAPQLLEPDPPIHTLVDSVFIVELQRRYGGIPPILLQDPELQAVFLPTIRADLEMIETYVYRDARPLDCPISCFGGLTDRRIDQDALDAWTAQTRGPFSVELFTGGHFYLQDQRALLLKSVSRSLSRSLAAGYRGSEGLLPRP